MRLLLVEDDVNLHSNIYELLSQHNYSIDSAYEGEDGLFKATEYEYDAAIIDVGLPKIDGFELIKQVREQSIEFPILILTARDRWQDKVEGLDLGADDYLSKPFQNEELVARINALIRRRSGQTQPVFTNGPYTLDTRAQTISLNEQLVDLSSHEYKLIEYLMSNIGKVCSKTKIIEHIYNEDFDLDSNIIEVFIGRLRKKLDPAQSIKPIETLRGRGYRMCKLD